jgi:hypothetical protein
MFRRDYGYTYVMPETINAEERARLAKSLFLWCGLSERTSFALAFADPDRAERMIADADAGRLDLSEVAEIEATADAESSDEAIKLAEELDEYRRRLFLEGCLSAEEADAAVSGLTFSESTYSAAVQLGDYDYLGDAVAV